MCDNCKIASGPFDKYFVGDRKVGRWIRVCNRANLEGCTARRKKIDNTIEQ